MPPSSCSRNSASCCPKYTANPSTVIPSTPCAPRLAFTRCNAFLRLLASHTSSISRSVAGFSVTPFTTRDSVPCSRLVWASPSPAPCKASSSWRFCRSSLMSRAPYSPLLFHVYVPFGPSACATVLTSTGGCPRPDLLCPLLTSAPRSVALPSRPGEFHPEPLTEPDVSLSTYPARATPRRLPPSAETKRDHPAKQLTHNWSRRE